MLKAAATTLLGALPASRAACAATSVASPCRLTSAPMATLTSFLSFSPPGSCKSASATFASIGYCAASSIETPCRLVTWVFGSICEAPEVSFMVWRGIIAPIACSVARSARCTAASPPPPAGPVPWAASSPMFEPNQGLSSSVPSGAKSGFAPFSFITAVSAAGMWAMLVTTAPLAENTGFSGVKMPSTPNFSMNQRSLLAASSAPPAIAPACPTARVSFALPAPDHARHHRLGELGVQFVIAPRLGVEHRRLAARIVGKREGELRRGEVDVDVLAAGDQRGGAPAPHAQICGDGGGETAGVGEDGDRALAQGLRRRVAAERAADAHLVPGVGHAQAVGAEDVDAVRWPMARISRASCTAIFSVTMKIFCRSGLTRISSATPSRAADGGR